MNYLNKLRFQYLSELESFYYPSILCTREELSMKPVLSKSIKETVREIKECFKVTSELEKWWKENIQPRETEIMNRDVKYYTRFL